MLLKVRKTWLTVADQLPTDVRLLSAFWPIIIAGIAVGGFCPPPSYLWLLKVRKKTWLNVADQLPTDVRLLSVLRPIKYSY